MYPWLQQRVEKFNPVLTDMKYQGMAQKQMLQSKAGSHSPEIHKVSVERKSILLLSLKSISVIHTCIDSDLLVLSLQLDWLLACPVITVCWGRNISEAIYVILRLISMLDS